MITAALVFLLSRMVLAVLWLVGLVRAARPERVVIEEPGVRIVITCDGVTREEVSA